MNFKLYSYSNPGGIDALTATLLGLVKPTVTVDRPNAHNAETSEVSLLDIFEATRFYHKRFGEQATMMEEHAYPSVTAEKKAGARGELDFRVITQVVDGGVALNLYVNGRRGSVHLRIERSKWSSRSAPKGDMVTDAQFYGKNAADEPFFIEGRETFAGELLALWYAKNDDAVVEKMVNLYEMLAPKKWRPAYVIINSPQQLPDCSEDAADGQRVTVEPGLYTLLGGDYNNPNAAYKQVLCSANGFFSTNAGMELTEWEAAAAASDGAVELVYHRESFSWMPQVGLADEVSARQAHDGQPFQVLDASFDEGFINAYRISFGDGFETWATPEEIEHTFDDEEEKLTDLEAAVLKLMRDRADGQASYFAAGLTLGRVGDALEAEAPDSLAWDWGALGQALARLVRLGQLVSAEEGFFKLPEWYIPADAPRAPSRS